MRKDCCNVKVAEIENGYVVEITGLDIKERCKEMLEDCCSTPKNR